MSEEDMPRVAFPPVLVHAVEPGEPPYRLIEVLGEVVGKAHGLTDVVTILHSAGIPASDIDDPDVVRWVGGDQYTWHVHHW